MWIDDSVSRSANLAKRGPATSMWWPSDAASAVEWDGTNLPDGKISRGLDAIVEHLTKWAELWETWEVELEQVIDADGDQVIVFIRERGRTTAGLEVNERHSELYTVRNGKIASRKGFSDADEAFNAAGLRQ